jgi:hypothetical protein
MIAEKEGWMFTKEERSLKWGSDNEMRLNIPIYLKITHLNKFTPYTDVCNFTPNVVWQRVTSWASDLNHARGRLTLLHENLQCRQ